MELGVVATWWLVFVVLVLAGWPVAGWVLREAPDRGVSLAAPAALVVVAIPTLWVGQASFDAGILVGAVLLATLSVLGWQNWSRTQGSIPWREFGVTLAVFTLAFGFMVVLRAAAPGIYPGGGEKFLDFGILQSLLRAERLPPPDMWFAGERVIYYYGGHMLAATLAKATGTPGVWAKVPALAGFYAMEVTAVYGLAQAIVSDRTDDPSAPTALPYRVGATLVAGLVGYWLFGVGVALVAAPAVFALFALSLSPARRAGVLAAFAFAFASNLLTPLRLAAGHLSQATLARLMATYGPSRSLDPVVTPDTFSYWPASRVIPDTINEFPLFAYRNGDLHAHMMSPTFLLLLVGVLFAFYHAPATERRRRAILLLATAPLTGVILTVNTWSFPTALGLVALGVAGARSPPWTLSERLADWSPAPASREVGRVAAGFFAAGVLAVLAVVTVWPFVVNVLLAGVGGRHPGFFPTRSGLGPFVIVHGAFAVTFAVYLAARGTGTRRGSALGVAAVPLLAAAGWQFDLVGLALVGPLVVVAWWLLRTERAGFEALLVAAAGGLVVLVEFVYLVDNAAPERFNTVFKVYFQVWTLWSVAMGVALSSVAGRGRETVAWPPGTLGDLAGVLRRGVGPLALAFLVVTTATYGGLVVQQHVGGADEYSLDAMTYAHTQHPDEAAAIEWLADREGQPTIVSKPCTAVYTWCNPASSLTGIPTVLGWGHESLYRGSDAYQSRQVAVSVLFDTEDPYSRALLLRKYDITYIYVGPRERAEYETRDYAAEPGISVAYANDNVVIYEVDQQALTNTTG